MQKFRHYFLIALRNFRRNKLHAAINVVGLSVGIAGCLLIFLIVRHETSFEKFRADKDRIYRIYTRFSGVFESTNRGVPTAVGDFAKENVSSFEEVAAFHTLNMDVQVVAADGSLDDQGRQNGIAVVDTSFFKIFPDYKWIVGRPNDVITKPGQVVLTDEKVKLYFGLEDPQKAVGRELRYRDSLALTVAGVIQKPKEQTDFYFSDFISFPTVQTSWLKNRIPRNDWGSTNSSSQLFVKLHPEGNLADVKEQLKAGEDIYKESHADFGFFAHFELQPLKELHFSTEFGIFDQSSWPAAHRPTLYLLMLIAGLILLIAGINFINLETAQSFRRAKEVGVRKVLGGSRRELMLQFLTETFFLTLIAVLLSLALSDWALRFFKDFVPEGLVFNPLSPSILGFLGSLTLLVCLLAGTYPAFVLSSFIPVQALKDRFYTGGRNSGKINLRRGLVVFQFFIAQVLIFGTLTVSRQIDYMLTKDMGFDQDAIVYFFAPWQDTSATRRAVLGQELKRLPEALAVSRYSGPPASNNYSSSVVKYQRSGEELSHNVFRKFGDTTYLKLHNIKLLAGRNVQASDTVREFLINETYARQLGFEQAEAALGERLELNDKKIPIVGVVQDFHIRSLHNPIEPVVIADESENFYCYGLKLSTQGGRARDFDVAIGKVKSLWEEIYPEYPFDYQFMDETLANFYESEQRVAKLSNTATTIAILISCLGLLGLVSFTAFQRTKEIGIRKVLGAKVRDIVLLMSRNFLLLVAIAFVLAVPVGWWAAELWLRDFAYRIGMSWQSFVFAGLLALAIAFLTISFHSVRAALANPVEALRNE